MSESAVRNSDIVLALLKKIQAGFWPSEKELNEAAAYLGKQERRIDELQAAINPFAKIGAKIDHALDISVVDYGNLQVTYADFVKAADVLYQKGLAAPSEPE